MPDALETILIVEDDAGVAALQRRRLERVGYRVVSAATAPEALQRVQQGGVQLILLDYRLPGGITGLDFYGQLKSAGLELPVIMVTGFSDEATVIMALRTGVRDFVTKSVEYLDYLPEAVSRVLKQVRTEQQLAESEARLGAIIDSANDAIVALEEDQRITLFNPAAERMFRCPGSEALGQQLTRFIPGLHDSRAEGSALAPQPAVAGPLDCTGLRSNGEEFPLEASVSRLEIAGRSMQTIVLRDITERRRAERLLQEKEEQLRQSQKLEAVGALAGGVAHEFNNLLQAIRGYTCFAMDGLSPDEQRHQDLQQVTVAADRATTLTRQLLTFSRRHELQKSWLDPNSIVRDLVRMLKPLLGAQIEIQVREGEQVGMLYADAATVEQMLMNLCINARDAMPGGGRLSIATASRTLDAPAPRQPAVSPGRYVLLTIADTGCGMEPDVKQRIFEPFFTTKEVGRGTGLGLAMVYGVVQQHEGAIEVDSQPGQGTIFRIYLPAASPVPDVCEEAAPQPPAAGCGTILVAEDEPMLCRLLVRTLQAAGYATLTAADGEEAVELFARHADEISAVLLDTCMPKLPGPQAYEQIARLCPDVAAVFCTGLSTGLGPARAAAEIPVIQKPFNKELLLRTLEDVIAARRSRRGDPLLVTS